MPPSERQQVREEPHSAALARPVHSEGISRIVGKLRQNSDKTPTSSTRHRNGAVTDGEKLSRAYIEDL